MNNRPLSVTIICWIYIVLSGLILLGTLTRLVHPASRQDVFQHWGYYAFTRLGPVFGVICGVFMLLGCNWARQLIFVWFMVAALSIVTYQPWNIWKPLLLFIAAIFFLFRPAATVYFKAIGQETPEIAKTHEISLGPDKS